MSTDGTKLISTYLGGSGEDELYDLCVGQDDSIAIAGRTTSPDFPQGLYNYTWLSQTGNAFVARMFPNSTLMWSTAFGNLTTLAEDVVIADDGTLIVSGHVGGDSIFVNKYSSQGELLWEYVFDHLVSDGFVIEDNDIEVDSNGNVYMTGTTQNNSYTVGDVPYPNYNGGWADGYLAKFSNTGALQWFTFLGGSAEDEGFGLTIDSKDNPIVTGFTFSEDFPKTYYQDPFVTIGSTEDAFVSKFSPNGSLLLSFTISGDGITYGKEIIVDNYDNVVVTGHTQSEIFPITIKNNTLGGEGGARDAFVTYINLTAMENPIITTEITSTTSLSTTEITSYTETSISTEIIGTSTEETTIQEITTEETSSQQSIPYNVSSTTIENYTSSTTTYLSNSSSSEESQITDKISTDLVDLVTPSFSLVVILVMFPLIILYRRKR